MEVGNEMLKKILDEISFSTDCNHPAIIAVRKQLGVVQSPADLHVNKYGSTRYSI